MASMATLLCARLAPSCLHWEDCSVGPSVETCHAPPRPWSSLGGGWAAGPSSLAWPSAHTSPQLHICGQLGTGAGCKWTLRSGGWPLSQPSITGDCWYHIPPPPKQRLSQVSVGQTSVYALDENGKWLLFLHGGRAGTAGRLWLPQEAGAACLWLSS